MANIFDYLEWRGDINLKESPFNEIDALLLAWLSYAPFEELMETGFKAKPVSIQEIAEKYLEKYDPKVVMETSLAFTKNAGLCLQQTAATRRFGNLKVFGLEYRTDTVAETQFAAMTYQINTHEFIVVFRGTDDTLVGWKEDFNMSFMKEVPAQKMALEYLETMAKKTKGKIYITGHSKGGNLAVYASSMASEETFKRIEAVYNNDGPGFGDISIIEPGYSRILPRLHSYLPEASIVGMLMEHDESYTAVKSTEKFINQHDASSWQLVGKRFIEVKDVKESSKALDITIKNWIRDIPAEERKQFIDALFKIMEANNATTTEDLSADMFKAMTGMVKEFNGMSAETKAMLRQVLKTFFKEGSEVIKSKVEPKIKEGQKTIKSKITPRKKENKLASEKV